MRTIHILSLVLASTVSTLTYADGPKDNIPDDVRRIPKLGIEVPPDQKKLIEENLTSLQDKIRRLQAIKDAKIQTLLPDVQIFHRAVHDALKYQEFFKPSEISDAGDLLKVGHERADHLAERKSPWMEATGLIVRGYVSRIDGSVQPYGLVVPDSYTHKTAGKYRLDIWFHGRGETLSEVNFLSQRSKQIGQFAPADTIVLHPYGRYSNAFKFAGEVDVLEALESVKSGYRVDEDRISVRGFSMGGAACWQFAVHYSDRWFAANPGAGFSETPQFLKSFQQETLNPTWYEEKLWRMYDCDLWARNLLQCPTIAYSGEIDRQKQAADVMEEALAKEGIDLVHIIGPQTGHRYHPEAQVEVAKRLDSIAAKGRVRIPRDVWLTTYTLKYNRMDWVTIDGMSKQWERSRVHGYISNSQLVRLATENVTDITLEIPAGWSPLSLTHGVTIIVNEQRVDTVRPKSDRSWFVQLHSVDDKWQIGPREQKGLRKKHDLQGPIDDALMDSFIFVRPTGKAWHESTAKWSQAELERAIEHWRRHFRGNARVKNDTGITQEDIASSNLILWGDPSSNKILGGIAWKLPIAWNNEHLQVGKQDFASDKHALIAIYPNPLNPDRYVVLNSSFTFREYAYLNNARQVPKLPDWAIVDLQTPPDSLWPGKIVAADFFDEHWQVKPQND